MTTIHELIEQTPAATHGVPTGFSFGAGEWRHVLELADPGVGSAVVWHDLTAVEGLFTGYDYTRGADGYQGRYRASVVTLDLYAKSDALAPWNPDTSGTFGTHIALGPGLLIRSGFIRVVDGAVVEWNPRFTNKVEFWGDSSYSRGKVRQHRVVARDTMSSLVGVPLPARTAENWFERFVWTLANSGWPYGWFAYGARHESDGTTPILLLPDRPASSSAINEMDATLDPAGLIWYTDRLGRLIVRPRVNDTFHAAAFLAGADGDVWTDAPNMSFAWWACGEQPGEYDGTDHAAYAVDTPGLDPFGFDESDRWVINHVKISDPTGPGFDDDDPVSIQRYDRKSMQAQWMVPNDVVASDLLTMRANATVEARPLNTNVRLKNFHPGPANIEFGDYLAIVHRNSDVGLEAFGNGWLRSYNERVRPLGCDTDWSLALTVDIYAMSVRETFLLPVEDLTLVDVTDLEATFSWTNPPQAITPTHTQVRLVNPASLWATVEYPMEGLTWSGLAPATGYEFQVRLIRQVDGITTHFSAIRSLNFTTDEPAAPYVDPCCDVFLPPADTGCVMGWELQQSTDGATWTPIDSGVDAEEPFVLPDFDFAALPTGYWYRFVSEESCGGILQGPKYGKPFSTACLGAARLGTAPYDDDALVAYWPEVCPTEITEAVSHTPMSIGHALTRVDVVDSIPVLMSGGEGMIGFQTVSAPAGDSDLTIACRIKLGTQPTTPKIVFSYGGLWISVVADAAGFRVIGNMRQAAELITIEGSVVHSLDTEYNLALTHSPSVLGKLTLYVDAVEEASVFPGLGDRTLRTMVMHLPADSWITDAAAWDRVLTELPGGGSSFLLDAAIMALGPAGYWPMLEISGSACLDVSGHGRHGSYSSHTVADRVGLDGRSYVTFDGVAATSGMIVTGNDTIWQIGHSGAGISWIAFVRYTSTPDVSDNACVICTNSADASNRNWRQRLYQALRPSVSSYYIGSSTAKQKMASADQVTADVWECHIGGFASSASLPVVYTDWVAIATSNTDIAAAADIAYPLRVGYWFNSNGRIVGAFAHVAVFPFVLSAGQVATLKAAAQADGWS